MDFMLMMQLICAGNSDAAGKECRSPGNGKNQAQFTANLQANLFDEFFPANGGNPAHRENADQAPLASATALIELLAMLPDQILQNREAGIPYSWLNAESKVDEMVLRLNAESKVDEMVLRLNAESKVDETVLRLNVIPGAEDKTNNQLQGGVATKQIINSDHAEWPGWLKLTPEQKQQSLQFLNRDNVQQMLKHWEQILLPADKTTAPGSNAAGVTPYAVGGAAAQNNLASLTELRDLFKSPDEKTPDNRLQTQPVLGKLETGPGINVSFSDLKSLVYNFDLSKATTVTQGRVEVNGPPNVNTVSETSNNAQRADLTQVVLNTFDSAATAAKSRGVETAPANRSSEPMFIQLVEAIRGQIAKDGHGSTHVRLQLQPESLGEVVIKLVFKDGNVSTHFHAATESARQIIESSLGQLRETLATHNINLQQSTVTTGGDQERWAQESNREHQFNRPFRKPGDGRGDREEPASEPAAELQKTNYQSRVNHFV